MMDRRKTCVNSRFDELWGEYKCMVKQHRLYIPHACARCEHYKPNKEKIRGGKKSNGNDT